jgi:hypothetical protein
LPVLSALSIAAAQASSAQATPDQSCHRACSNCVEYLVFADAHSNSTGRVLESVPESICASRNAVLSTYLCLRAYCASDTETAADGVVEDCKGAYGLEAPRYADTVGSMSDEDVEGVRRVGTDDQARILEEMVLPTEEYYVRWERTLDDWEFVSLRHYQYG